MTFVDVIMIGFSGALMSHFFGVCLEEGMIFQRWGAFVSQGKWWQKIMGGCIYCTSVYITGIMAFLYIFTSVAWGICTAIALSFFLIAIMDKNGMLQ